MDFVIAIRSYNRADILETHTYKIIRRNNLEDKTYIFVREEEVQKYQRFPNLVPVRAYSGIEKILRITEYFPIGQRIVFMDDDNIDFYHFNKDNKPTRNSTKLRALIEDGFNLIDRFNLGAFSCSMNTKGSYINPLYIKGKPEREFTFKFLQGVFFGCRNDPSLINTIGQEDVERTANYFERYKGILFYWRAGFKNDFGRGAGGSADSAMRASQTRHQETKKTADELFLRKPLVFQGVKFNTVYDWYDLKFKNARVLKKLLNPPQIQLPSSQLFEDNTD